MALVLNGVGVSAGVAAGPVARMAPPPAIPPDLARRADAEDEAAAAVVALEEVATLLDDRAAHAAEEAAGVLAAQAMIARDPGLIEKTNAAAEAGRSAVHAVSEAFGEYRAILSAAGPYMAERVADLDDLANRAIAIL